MNITVELSFCCAHHLPNYEGNCRRLHGHNYKLAVTVSGKPHPQSGMIVDFEELRNNVLEHAINLVDHQNLNDLVPNPTAENLVVFFWSKLQGKIPGLVKLRLFETPEYSVTYRGD
jgi:6-pyruvoyltetrahydropterin/6-carboxytetrahydropterin synthase